MCFKLPFTIVWVQFDQCAMSHYYDTPRGKMRYVMCPECMLEWATVSASVGAECVAVHVRHAHWRGGKTSRARLWSLCFHCTRFEAAAPQSFAPTPRNCRVSATRLLAELDAGDAALRR